MCISGQALILLCVWLEKDENIHVLISYAVCHHVKKQTAQDQTELPFDGLRDRDIAQINKLEINVNPAFSTKLCYETVKN
jgi:hypothetical protein